MLYSKRKIRKKGLSSLRTFITSTLVELFHRSEMFQVSGFELPFDLWQHQDLQSICLMLSKKVKKNETPFNYCAVKLRKITFNTSQLSHALLRHTIKRLWYWYYFLSESQGFRIVALCAAVSEKATAERTFHQVSQPRSTCYSKPDGIQIVNLFTISAHSNRYNLRFPNSFCHKVVLASET